MKIQGLTIEASMTAGKTIFASVVSVDIEFGNAVHAL